MNPEYKLIIDTREQLALPFKKNIDVKKLPAGDYGAELNGILLPIIFERKNPMDALQTLVQGHERFTRELGIAYQQKLKIIVLIECSYTDFVSKNFHGSHNSRLKTMVLQKILHSTIISHDLEIHFFNNRQEETKFIRNYFNALVKYELKHNPEKYGLKKERKE